MTPPLGTRWSRWPWKMWRSVPQIPTRRTRSKASPAPGFGTGTSTVVNRPAPPYEDARMAAILPRAGGLGPWKRVHHRRDHGLVDRVDDAGHRADDLERRALVAVRIGEAAQGQPLPLRLDGEPLAARARVGGEARARQRGARAVERGGLRV